MDLLLEVDHENVTAEERVLIAFLEYQRIVLDDRPSSYRECLNEDGNIDFDLHRQYLEKEDDLEAAEKKRFQCLRAVLEEEERREEKRTKKIGKGAERPRKTISQSSSSTSICSSITCDPTIMIVDAGRDRAKTNRRGKECS